MQYTAEGADVLGKYAVFSCLLGTQPWTTPTLEDYQLLSQVLPTSYSSPPCLTLDSHVLLFEFVVLGQSGHDRPVVEVGPETK